MLHQSAEQALRALLKAGTGYHANTHSIDRLLRYGSLVAHQLPEIFPRQTEQEKRLFNLLQKAYIDTRYKEDYKITDEELSTLTGKIRRIHEVLSDAGKCFINALLQPELQNTSQ
ncbi:HEPN domain-containing protein [Niabella hirudinis]